MTKKLGEIWNTTKETKIFFNCCAETWDDHCERSSCKIAAIVTLAGVAQGSRVADIACGTGVLFPEILSRKPGLLLGVDLSDKMIEKARSKFSDPHLRLMASDCFEVQETGFDVILLYNAYPHFPDKARLAKHMAEMLRTGGRLMVAHSESRDAVNSHHVGKEVSRISWSLQSAEEEAAKFAEKFCIDMIADTNNIYFFSGIRK